MGYTHIEESERRCIERALERGKSIRAIARMLGRSVSTISEEVRMNSVRHRYRAVRAGEKSVLRRRQSKIQCLKVAMDPALKTYVTTHLSADQSPESIAGRLRAVDTHLTYASTKAIYRFVYSPHGRNLEPHLYGNMVKKKPGPKRGTQKPVMDGRTMIDIRPSIVASREEFGHFEGDFIESGKDGVGSLLVLVERKTRYPFLIYTEDRSTAHINALIGEALRGVPLLSLTLDNDLSFQKHEALSELISATVFFCHPFASHEKGTVENRNRGVRRYLPKKTDLSQIPLTRIAEIETILRTRFMKCLQFKTAQEAWEEDMKKAALSGSGTLEIHLATNAGCSA